MLKVTPHERITACEALGHPFLNDVSVSAPGLRRNSARSNLKLLDEERCSGEHPR